MSVNARRRLCRGVSSNMLNLSDEMGWMSDSGLICWYISLKKAGGIWFGCAVECEYEETRIGRMSCFCDSKTTALKPNRLCGFNTLNAVQKDWVKGRATRGGKIPNAP